MRLYSLWNGAAALDAEKLRQVEQECADLGAECRSYTYAASVCDFKAIRDVCPRVRSSADAAECVEMVLEQHRHGRTVPKNFLNMSHAHCTDVLRGLGLERHCV